MTGFNEAALDIDQAETFAQAETSALAVKHSMFFNEHLRDDEGCGSNPPAPAEGRNCAVNFVDEDGDPFTVTDFVTDGADFGSVMNEVGVDPGLSAAAFDPAAPDFRPAAGGAALEGGVPPPDDEFFEDAPYRGGVNRGGADSNWYSWTSF